MHPLALPDEHPLDFTDAVHQLAKMIPAGHVLSYGDIAELLESGGARQVGKAMQVSADEVPWWRVIRNDGLITETLYPSAQAHWLSEKTPCRGRKVNMAQARWKPNPLQYAEIQKLADSLS